MEEKKESHSLSLNLSRSHTFTHTHTNTGRVKVQFLSEEAQGRDRMEEEKEYQIKKNNVFQRPFRVVNTTLRLSGLPPKLSGKFVIDFESSRNELTGTLVRYAGKF